jgi:uncharacterized protein
MQFSQEQDHLSYTIRACHDDRVDIIHPVSRTADSHPSDRNESLTGSFIMTSKQLIRDWPPETSDQLTKEHFAVFLELRPEVLLLGTGQNLVFPDMGVLAGLMGAGIGVEVMGTAAACRTYNILMHEGRNVAVALLQ